MDIGIVSSTVPAEIVYQDTSIVNIEVAVSIKGNWYLTYEGLLLRKYKSGTIQFACADTSTITIRKLMLPALSTKYKACLHDINKTVSIEVEF